jgi:hypothetical protein
MDSHPSSRFAVRRSLLVSLFAHAAAVLVLAALLQPAGSGRSPPLALEVSSVERMPEIETLVMSDSLLPPDAGSLLSESESDPFADSGAGAGLLSPESSWPDSHNGLDAEAASRRGSGPGASFFGTVAHGDQFVYIVDISTSMDQGQGASASEGSRLVRALAELRASIDRLSERQSFYVILFNGQTRRMFDDGAVFPQFLEATAENKQRLNEWLATVRSGASTDPREAIRLGLGMQGSALFLLSDGEFNGQQTSINTDLLNGNPGVFDVVDRHNRSRTPIHTVAYEDKANGKVMEQIARSTGGAYRFVPPHASVAASSSAAASSAASSVTPAELQNNRANFLLFRAQSLESHGRDKQAQAIYRRIERDFSGTDAAQAAAEKISQLSASEP